MAYPAYHATAGPTGWYQALKDYIDTGDAGVSNFLVEHNSDGTHDFPGTPTGAKFLRDDRTWASPSTGAGYPVTALVAYVDYANGSDTNDGLSPSSAYKTIQAAYDDLKAYANANYTALSNGQGVGTIFLLPGAHDVGAAGFVMDCGSPAAIVGNPSGWNRQVPAGSEAMIVSSSSSTVQLVKSSILNHATNVQYGGTFRDISFRVDPAVNTSLTACLRSYATDFLEVEGCKFAVTEGSAQNQDKWAIDQASSSTNDDNAWFRIVNNKSSGLGFWRALIGSGNGTNFNRGLVSDNKVFYNNTSNAMFYLQGDVQSSLFENNNCEGASVAFRLSSGAADRNMFINNHGEDFASGTATFYDFTDSCQFNIIIGGYCSAWADTTGGTPVTGTWATFGTSAWGNTVIGTVDYTGLGGFKQKIVDSSTLKNLIINPNGPYLRTISGAGKTKLAAADLPFGTQENGTVAIVRNSSDSTSRISWKDSGSYYSVQGT